MVSYYIKWVTMSWTYSTVNSCQSCFIRLIFLWRNRLIGLIKGRKKVYVFYKVGGLKGILFIYTIIHTKVKCKEVKVEFRATLCTRSLVHFYILSRFITMDKTSWTISRDVQGHTLIHKWGI